jgi:flagellar motor switch protein FliG
MASNVLTGLEKSAILLMCLGEQAAAQVFNELTDTQVQAISATMSTIDHIPARLKRRILEQYRDARLQFTGDFFNGGEFARNSINATNSGERTQALLQRHLSDTESKPFSMVAEIKPQLAAAILEKEHPQIIALIVSAQSGEHGAAIVSCLPETMQADIVQRIARLDHVAEEIIDSLENSLISEIGPNLPHKQKQIDGFGRAVDVLRNMSTPLHNTILDTLEQIDDSLADKMRRQIFTFENLIDLDDRSLQMILREISNESLAIALQNCSNELKNRIFGNMSPRAVAMVRDDIESVGKIRASEVRAMQQSIVKTALRLEETGAFKANPL